MISFSVGISLPGNGARTRQWGGLGGGGGAGGGAHAIHILYLGRCLALLAIIGKLAIININTGKKKLANLEN